MQAVNTLQGVVEVEYEPEKQYMFPKVITARILNEVPTRYENFSGGECVGRCHKSKGGKDFYFIGKPIDKNEELSFVIET
jgi:hypothetical protein